MGRELMAPGVPPEVDEKEAREPDPGSRACHPEANTPPASWLSVLPSLLFLLQLVLFLLCFPSCPGRMAFFVWKCCLLFFAGGL